MKIRYSLTGDKRKALAAEISRITGEEAKYLGVPTCSYQIGGNTIDREGTLETESVELVTELAEAGYTQVPEEVQPTVSFPLGKHTAGSLRNLLNLIYTREHLINKALGSHFHVGIDLVMAVAEARTVEQVADAVKEEESEGIEIKEGMVSFTGFPPSTDPDFIAACTNLAACMNRQALTQKRIQAKLLDEPNEKFSLRTWLVRCGMAGPDYKTTRKILLQNLSGHSAFRTPEQAEAAKAKRG